MEFDFKTINKPIENILLKEKGSKFIGFAFPVNDEKELKSSLEKIRNEHPKATHHCYAFRLGLIIVQMMTANRMEVQDYQFTINFSLMN